MTAVDGTSGIDRQRIRSAWQGRISGCLLRMPLEGRSFERGPRGVEECLRGAGAVPLRDIPSGATAPLAAGKVIGLMVAYCDNDGSEYRENFVGSEAVPFDKKDRGWIDADLFGKLVLDAPR